jgi:ABC-2 type transport system permease protein
MKSLPGYLRAIAAIVRRDVTIFLSYRLRWLSRVTGTILTLVTFYYVSKLVRPNAVGPHSSYFAYLMIGVVFIPVLTAALTLSQFVRQELVAGTFERTLVSAAGPVTACLAMLIFPVALSLVLSIITLALGVALFSVHLHASGIPVALGVAVLGTIAFGAIGVLFVSALMAFKSAAGVTWVLSGLSLIGSVYFPIRLFPGWIRWAADAQPLSPALDLLRHALVGTKTVRPVWLELVTLLGFTVVLLPVAAVLLAVSIRFSRQRGTILEY